MIRWLYKLLVDAVYCEAGCGMYCMLRKPTASTKLYSAGMLTKCLACGCQVVSTQLQYVSLFLRHTVRCQVLQ